MNMFNSYATENILNTAIHPNKNYLNYQDYNRYNSDNIYGGTKNYDINNIHYNSNYIHNYSNDYSNNYANNYSNNYGNNYNRSMNSNYYNSNNRESNNNDMYNGSNDNCDNYNLLANYNSFNKGYNSDSNYNYSYNNNYEYMKDTQNNNYRCSNKNQSNVYMNYEKKDNNNKLFTYTYTNDEHNNNDEHQKVNLSNTVDYFKTKYDSYNINNYYNNKPVSFEETYNKHKDIIDENNKALEQGKNSNNINFSMLNRNYLSEEDNKQNNDRDTYPQNPTNNNLNNDSINSKIPCVEIPKEKEYIRQSSLPFKRPKEEIEYDPDKMLRAMIQKIRKMQIKICEIKRPAKEEIKEKKEQLKKKMLLNKTTRMSTNKNSSVLNTLGVTNGNKNLNTARLNNTISSNSTNSLAKNLTTMAKKTKEEEWKDKLEILQIDFDDNKEQFDQLLKENQKIVDTINFKQMKVSQMNELQNGQEDLKNYNKFINDKLEKSEKIRKKQEIMIDKITEEIKELRKMVNKRSPFETDEKL